MRALLFLLALSTALEANPTMTLADEELDVRVAGPVAELTVRQTWQNGNPWVADEAMTEVRTGHLSALTDYWITEDGARHEGVVRDRTSAVGEYRANLARQRDPGLVEWIDEGRYRFRLYPVPANGGTKEQGFRLITALPVRPDGRLRFEWHFPACAVRRTRIRLSGARFPDGTQVFEARDLPRGAKPISFELEAGIPAGPGALSWRADTGERALTVTRTTDAGPRPDFRAWIGPVTDAHHDIVFRTIPIGWLALLERSARALRLELDEGRLRDALGELRAAKIVGPEVVLFANPFATRAMIDKGWSDAFARVAEQTAESWLPLDFYVPVVGPAIKAHELRRELKACFAIQRTVIGALEMYNLDKNWKFEGEPLGSRVPVAAPRSGPLPWLAAAPSSPAGIEASRWREPDRIAKYRAYRDLTEDPSARPVLTYHPPIRPDEVRRLGPAMWRTLHEGGYLERLPSDPGQGPGTHHNFVMYDHANGIFCLRHGGILGGDVSARRQLELAGVTDPATLSLASPLAPCDPGPRRTTPGSGWFVALAALGLLRARRG